MQRKAAAYIRVSTQEQAEYSPESQLRLIRSYAKKNSLELPEGFVFIDEGISGRTVRHRPEFLRMISIAKEKPRPFDVILLWRFSRFARSREDSVVYKSLLRRQCKIDVISVGEPMPDDKTSVLMEALIEAMDEYYSINLAEEVRRGMREKLRRGEYITAPAFGYFMSQRRLRVSADGAAVKSIFSDFISGIAPCDIAKRLNDENITTTRGRKFTSRAVVNILKNPLYAGKLRHRREDGGWQLTNGIHEPLISIKDFIAAEKLLIDGKGAGAAKKATAPPEPFLLYPILTCASCGAPLVRSGGGGLRCGQYAKGRCRFQQSISEQEILARVFEKLYSDLSGGCGYEYGSQEMSPLSLSLLERLSAILGSGDYKLKQKAIRRVVSLITYSKTENSVRLYYRVSGLTH